MQYWNDGIESKQKNDELCHYGILGMRWGIRRTPEQLRALSGRLESNSQKIGETIVAAKSKAASADAKASRLRAKENGFFVSDRKAKKLDYKAQKQDEKSKRYNAQASRLKAQYTKNKELISIYNKTADSIEAGTTKTWAFLMKYADINYDDIMKITG